MKTGSTIQEILLMTNTTFSKKQLCETDVKNRNYKLSPAEQLEAACWNGLLDEWLPEIMGSSLHDKKIFLWQVEMKKFHIWISRAEYPSVQKNCSTLDPYALLQLQEVN